MSNTLGSWFFLIPLCAAVIWIIVNFMIGLRKVNIITNGELTEGKMVNKKGTFMSINDHTVYKLTFEFRTKTGSNHSITTKTHKTEKFEKSKAQPIIYDTRDPNKGLVLKSLPWSLGNTMKEKWY